jgi:MFS transporter, UMF1 family
MRYAHADRLLLLSALDVGTSLATFLYSKEAQHVMHKNAYNANQHDTPQETQQTSALGLVSWALYDWANSAFATVIQTFVFATYFTQQVAANATAGTVLWSNTVMAAGIVIALGGPIVGAVADQGGRSKPWIATFTALCVGATALLWFVEPSPAFVWPAVLLVGLGTIGAEFATIFYNALLPRLAAPERVGRWSGWAWSLGYAGGLVCLIVALLAFVREDNPWFALDRHSAQPVRAVFLLAAGWYLLFALPFFCFTPDPHRAGKPLARAVRDGLQQLWASLRDLRQYGHLVRFLIAHMLYIDGLATIFAFGGIYAAGVFTMNAQEVLLFGIALNATAGLGAAGFAWVDDWLGAKPTILIALGGLIVFTTLILVVESRQWFWVCGLLLGIFVGPVQAASRSYLARLAPAPLQNQLFGLFALSGKATAFLGPLCVGWVIAWTGSQRLGLSPILGFFLVGFVLMLWIPADGNRVSASRYTEEHG